MKTAAVKRQGQATTWKKHIRASNHVEEIQHKKTQQALACQGSQRHAFSTRSAMSEFESLIKVKASDSIAQSLM